MTRSRIVPLILLIAFFANPCYATSNSTIQKNKQDKLQATDVAPFDPIKFINHMKEDAARDKTRVRNCYNGANIDFSFATVADENAEKQPLLEYDSVSDRNGRTYHISKRPVIDRDDVAVVCVDKTAYSGNEQYSIIAFFKESSWDKVHDVTQGLIKKRIACLKSRTVISMPIVFDVIVRSAQLAVLNKAGDVDWFIQGLIPTNEHPEDSQEKAYAAWLERRVHNYPDDLESLKSLAREYAKIKPDCKKSQVIFENVIKLDTSTNFSYYFSMLNACYKDSHDFERAIQFYSSLISEKTIEPLTEIYLRVALASAYDGKRDTQKTLQELSRALAAAKILPSSYPWLQGSPSKETFEKKLQDDKTKMINAIESEIEKIKSQENGLSGK